MYKWRDRITHRAKIVTKIVVYCNLFIVYYRATTKEKREKIDTWNSVINTMYNIVAHKYGKLVALELAPTCTQTYTRAYAHAYTPVEGASI